MRGEKAFTLVEVILAMGIFAIVAIPIVSMFLDGIKITSKSENTSEAYAYAQQYIEKLKGGEIEVEEVYDEPIDDTEYEYSITVTPTNESVINDGEDFYIYLNETDSCKMVLSDSSLKIDTTVRNSFENVSIDENYDWVIDDTTVSVGKDKIWIQYGDLTEKKTLTVNNESGAPVSIYMQWTGSNENKKNNLNIKNVGGIINVYGPVDKTIDEINSEKRGRKNNADVTVTVRNSRTGEHAELTANVIYYK